MHCNPGEFDISLYVILSRIACYHSNTGRDNKKIFSQENRLFFYTQTAYGGKYKLYTVTYTIHSKS